MTVGIPDTIHRSTACGKGCGRLYEAEVADDTPGTVHNRRVTPFASDAARPPDLPRPGSGPVCPDDLRTTVGTSLWRDVELLHEAADNAARSTAPLRHAQDHQQPVHTPERHRSAQKLPERHGSARLSPGSTGPMTTMRPPDQPFTPTHGEPARCGSRVVLPARSPCLGTRPRPGDATLSARARPTRGKWVGLS